jgi:hypothetical protein
MTIAPHKDVLDYTHTFIATYARQRFLIPTAEALSVAAHELLDNALNYGSINKEVVLELTETPNSKAVRVSNEAIPTRIGFLTRHMERLWANPEAVFLEEMRRSFSGGTTRPTLGLARVMHEAGLCVEIFVDGNRVTVIARA